MTTGQTSSVVDASLRVVFHDMLVVVLSQTLDGRLDLRESALLSHLLSAEVAVSASTVPVARNRLRVECDRNVEVFGNSVKQESGHPEVIANGYALAGTNLSDESQSECLVILNAILFCLVCNMLSNLICASIASMHKKLRVSQVIGICNESNLQ